MSGKRWLAALALALWAGGLAVPGALRAQEGGEGGESSPQDLAREGAQRLLDALEGLLQVIPQYGVPKVLDNGDILIPRLNPPQEEGDGGEGDGGEDTPSTEDDDTGSREI